MKLLSIMGIWIVMGAILAAGILLAVKGKPWVLVLGVIGFVVAVGRIGCLQK